MSSSFIYPRSISVRRPIADSDAGAVDYSGLLAVNEEVVALDIPCSIQYDRVGKMIDADLPADSTGRSAWKIFIPRQSLAKGMVQKNDVIVDDLGERYQVTAPYWNSLGYQIHAEVLTV